MAELTPEKKQGRKRLNKIIIFSFLGILGVIVIAGIVGKKPSRDYAKELDSSLAVSRVADSVAEVKKAADFAAMPKKEQEAILAAARRDSIQKVKDDATRAENAAQAAITAEPGMTMAKFNQIHNGMTMAAVERIIGSSGEVTSEAGEGQYQMTLKTYKAENGIANAVISYTAGKVSSKAQIALK
jgi:hypothetical protein